MKENKFDFLRRAYCLLLEGPATWGKIVQENAVKGVVFRNYFLPWSYICIAIVFFFNMIHARERAFQVGFLNAIVCAAALLGGFFLCRFILTNLFRRKEIKYTETGIEQLIVYSFTIVFLLKILTAIFPSLFFIQLLIVCTGFIVWDAAKTLFDVTEDNQNFIVIAATLSIIFIPVFITSGLRLMIPVI